MRINLDHLELSAKMFRAYYGSEHADRVEQAASELNRLYALEDATTPFASRAEVEAAIKGYGWAYNAQFEQYEKGRECAWFERDNKRFFVEKFDTSYMLPLSALTPALLDKILEKK